MYFAIVTNHGRPIQNAAERLADLTVERLRPVSTRSQVKEAVLTAIAQLEQETKAESARLEGKHH